MWNLKSKQTNPQIELTDTENILVVARVGDKKLGEMSEESQKVQIFNYKIKKPGTSLVAQWLTIRRPMQGTRGRSLVREDPTCCGAAEPVRHNC